MSKNPYYNHDSKLQDLYPEGDGSFLGGGGGGGFEPTPTQMEAINSGATESKINQIQTNANNINNKLTKLTDEGEFVYSHEGDIQTSKGFEVADEPSGSAAHVTSSKTVKAVKTALTTEINKKLTATGADRGLNITSNKVGHSNSITVPTANRIIQGTYDAQGHLTAIQAELNWSNAYKTSADNQLFTRKGANAMYKELTEWNYVGILGTTSGSVLTVKDDWNELLFICRCAEGSSFYNVTNVVPKLGFTQGSPTNNSTFIGFFYNTNFYVSVRIGLSGTGDSRQVKVGVINQNGWNNNGIYVYKR